MSRTRSGAPTPISFFAVPLVTGHGPAITHPRRCQYRLTTIACRVPTIEKTDPLQAVLCTFLMTKRLLGSVGICDRSTCTSCVGTTYRIAVISSRVDRIPSIAADLHDHWRVAPRWAAAQRAILAITHAFERASPRAPRGTPLLSPPLGERRWPSRTCPVRGLRLLKGPAHDR